jgi:hypothetical protein
MFRCCAFRARARACAAHSSRETLLIIDRQDCNKVPHEDSYQAGGVPAPKRSGCGCKILLPPPPPSRIRVGR